MWQTIKNKIDNHLQVVSWFSIGIGLILFITACFILFVREDSSLETAAEDETAAFLTESGSESVIEDNSLKESTETVPSVLYVDVKGAVQQPGVYQATPGMRLMDAIDLAGGFLISADQSHINLALKLEDQMVIHVPQVGEETNESAQETIAGGTAAEEEEEKININTADALQLQSLTGIGEKKAELIIQYREENGSFQTIEDLKKVSGIGEKTFDALKDFIVAGSE